MDSIVFHCQSPLRLSNSTALSKIQLTKHIFPRKEPLWVSLAGEKKITVVSPFVSRKQDDDDGRGRKSPTSKRRNSALGRRLPNDHGNKPEQQQKQKESSGTESPKNHEEIISIIKRIRSSIAKENLKLNERNSKSSDGNASLESVLEVFRQSTSTPGKSARKEGNKTLPRIRDSSQKESSFVRKFSIPSLEQEQESVTGEEKRHEFLEQIDKLEIEKMKLHQLKELAKSKGIKGCSRMKKAELIQLLLR